MAQCNVAGADPVGSARVGSAVLDGLGPFGALLEDKSRKHKKLTDWARQMLIQVRRWLPERVLVVVADSSFAVLALLERLRRLPNPICMVTRLRLDAALYEPAPSREPSQKGRPRLKGDRLPNRGNSGRCPNTLAEGGDPRLVWREGPADRDRVEHSGLVSFGDAPVPIRWVLIRDPQGKFKSQAVLCTDLNADPIQIVKWFVMRWRLEVTFQKVRTHLGVETQRQWSDKAITRTTPALLGLFSLVTLLAHASTRQGKLPVRQAAWYEKPMPTFSDALAIVRHTVWQEMSFHMSVSEADMQKVPRILLNRFFDALCYADRR